MSAQQILPFLLHDRGRFIRRSRLPVLDRWQEARGQSKLNLLHLCHTIEAGQLVLLREGQQFLQRLLRPRQIASGLVQTCLEQRTREENPHLNKVCP